MFTHKLNYRETIGAFQNMLIIFLDIDGVLLHTKYKDRIPYYLKQRYSELQIEKTKQDFSGKACDKAAVECFDKSALANLNRLIFFAENEGEDVGIVISSNWRLYRSVEQLKDLFKEHEFSAYILDKTVDSVRLYNFEIKTLPYLLGRGEEIETWLRQNGARLGVSNYLILDDIDRGIAELHPKNYVRCDNGVFDIIDLGKALSLIKNKSCLEKLFSCFKKKLNNETKQIHPVNKLNLIIKDEHIYGETELKISLNLRVTSNTRRCYLSSYLTKLGLFQIISKNQDSTCVDLISEYDADDFNSITPRNSSLRSE